ncbi:MAG: VOC family protein [Mariprofundaceae bacterium]|nr:VOC family protein [Mariprofundaceae bacterium]
MRLHHVAIIAGDLERSAHFYEDILGLERDVRPDPGFPGLFYGLGGGQQLHLMQIDDPCGGYLRPEHGGRDRHFALAVDALDRFAEQLEQAGIAYTMSRSGRAALFCRDPDGNAIEIIQGD